MVWFEKIYRYMKKDSEGMDGYMHKFMLLNKNKIVISNGDSSCDEKYIATIISNLSALGYVLSEEIIEVLRTNDEQFVVNFYKELVTNIRN